MILKAKLNRERWLDGESSRARTIDPWERTLRWARRRPAVAVVAGTIIGVCLFGCALWGCQNALRAEQAADDRPGAEEKVRRSTQEEARARDEARREAAARAEAARRTTRLVEAHLALERAMNHCQRDEIADGLTWLAHGLEVVPEDEVELQLSFRRLLRGWSRHIHPLKQVLPIACDPNLQIAQSPDGKMLATGRDKPAGVQLWDAVTGKPLGQPLPLPGPPWYVVFGPKGTFLVVACYDESLERNSIQFWDIATRRPIGERILLAEARGDDRQGDRAALSPDGKRLVTVHNRRRRENDFGVRLWEVPRGKPIGEPLTTEPVRTVVFSPDSKTLLTAGDEVRCWDGRTGKPIGKSVEPSDKVTTTAFGPDGKTFITAGYNPMPGAEGRLYSLRIFETATRKLLSEYRQVRDWAIDQVAFGPDGQSILVWYWDASCTNCPRVQMFRYGPGWRVIGSPMPAQLTYAFTGDGRTVLLVNDLWQARLWDTHTGQPMGDIPQIQLAWWVGCDPGGKTMLIANGTDIRRWEIATPPTGRKLEWPQEGGFNSLAFSPDSKKLAMAVVQRDRSEVRFWDPVTAKLTGETIPLGDGKRQVTYLVYSPDGKVLLTLDTGYPLNKVPASARLWDSTTRKSIGEPILVQWQSRGHTVAFSPDSKRLLTAFGKVTRLYDTATGQPAGKPLEHGDVIRAVAFSPDGKRILTGGDDKSARQWDAATGRPIGAALHHSAAVNHVAFSPDGTKVLTSEEQTARLWNAATGQPIGAPIRHGSPVPRWSPDSKTVLIAAPDPSGGKNWDGVRLWDADTGKPRGRYLHHGAMIVDMAFSPDGRTMLTAGSGTYGTEGIQLWDVATERPIGKVLWTHWYEQLNVVGVSALFSPDSRTLLAKTFFHETRPVFQGDRYFDEARLFEVPPPVQGDVARLRLWVEVITARELDAGGEITDLDARTWQQRWQQLHKLGGPP